MGTASPAAAADEQKPIDNAKIYSSEQDVVARMEGTDGMTDKDGKPVPGYAPVADSESVMGYPKGVDRDKDNKVMPVYKDDVQAQYDAKQAVVDAKAAAKKYAEDTTNNPQPLRETAKLLADSPLTDPEVRGDTNDDAIFGRGGPEPGAEHTEMYCAGKHAPAPGGRVDQNAAKANPCVFVGKLDKKDGSKYPKVGGSSGMAGGGEKTYTVAGETTEEKSSTEGWAVGGKFTPKVSLTPAGDKGGAGGELGAEASFTYSYSSTTTNKVSTKQQDETKVTFPSDKKGSLQGRRDGAYYVGYIVVRKTNALPEDNIGQEHLIAIPARVYVQSPQSSTSVTYFKYQE
ncbi:hypothetical protein ACIGT4_33625 [Streptomyces sioyaensis]|uniref:hypothetical protein n=1 Tax=Streptomyces sioyaensis TaxID=67364 RepID=UPI0037D69EC6